MEKYDKKLLLFFLGKYIYNIKLTVANAIGKYPFWRLSQHCNLCLIRNRSAYETSEMVSKQKWLIKDEDGV